MLGDGLAVFFREIGRNDVAHTQAVAGGLVGVGGPDTLEGGTDFLVALLGFVGGIQQSVCGQDEVSLFGDEKIVGRRESHVFQGIDFLLKGDRVNHDAIADDVGFFLVEDAGWDDVEHVADAVELQRVAGVGTALEAGHHIVFRGHHVHDFALALVAPLQTE